MSEPMCAPIDARRPPDDRAGGAAELVEAIPNFGAAPVARCGCVSASMPGLTRIPIRPRRRGAAHRARRATRRYERAAGEGRREVGVGLADAVDDDPLRVRARARSERQLDRPTTSKPMPSAARRRSSAGSGFALTA